VVFYVAARMRRPVFSLPVDESLLSNMMMALMARRVFGWEILMFLGLLCQG
jgi:hypothetical protein